MNIASVILDIPTQSLDRVFCYAVPEGMDDAAVGCAVVVPFGNRPAIGYIVELANLDAGDLAQRGLDTQKLKAIEGELSKRSELDKTQTEAGVSCGNDEDIYGKYPLAQNCREEIETKISGFSHSKTPRLDAYVNTLEELLTLAENKLNEKENLPEKDFSDEIVKEYLKKVALSRPRAVISGGTVLSAPPNKPTSIAEASAIAKNYLKRKGE
jgi:hypothetical protein